MPEISDSERKILEELREASVTGKFDQLLKQAAKTGVLRRPASLTKHETEDALKKIKRTPDPRNR